MALRYLNDPAPTLGMMRDMASWEIPPGGVYDSLNMIFDRPGMSRQRGGTTALVSGAQTAFATSLGFCYSTDATTIEELYGCAAAGLGTYLINKTTGATTPLTSTSGTYRVGRPARHFGFIVFTGATTTTAYYRATILAGQTNATTFTSAATAAVAANNAQITLSGADVTTNIQVGAMVRATDTAANMYSGRVISIDTTKLFTVWPTPTASFTAVIGGLITGPSTFSAAVDPNFFGGACVTSFQNRLLYGGVNQPGSTPVTRYDRRVSYSPLPTETGTWNSVVGGMTGAVFVGASTWPALNYFDIPGADPIVAMEPLAENALLILTGNQPVILDGNLATQLATTNPTITFDESSILQPAGCLSDLSVQRTPRGIVWAGVGGIYAYDGGRRIDDLTDKRINSYWRSLTSDATCVIHGAAYVRNHYIVSGTSGGVTFSLACNMQNLQWTRLSGAGTDIFYGAARPTNPAHVFASRWWDQTGAAPSMTNGQTVRLESMLAPYTTGSTKTDSDATAVPVSLTTRVIGGDVETQKLFQRGTVRHQQSSTTAAMTVTAQSKIDAADIDASSVRTLGSLSNTATLTITNATNASPIVVTTGTHGLQTDDFVDIDAVLGNLNANGRWRIAVINTTSFSLVGSTGSAAYSSGGKAKKLTETDYLMSPLNAGQGASLTISGSPNNFELHGIRLAVLERQPVMSA